MPRAYEENGVWLKACTGCGETKSTLEFYKCRAKSDGLHSRCKRCIGEQQREYYESNKDKKREYYESNKDTIRDYQREYYESNKDKILEQQREYYESNKDKILEQQRDYHESNKDTIRDYQREYYESNKDKKRGYRVVRYGMTIDDYLTLREFQDDRCGVCDDDFSTLPETPHVDHDNTHPENKGVGYKEAVRGILCPTCNQTAVQCYENGKSLPSYVPVDKVKAYLANPPAWQLWGVPDYIKQSDQLEAAA